MSKQLLPMGATRVTVSLRDKRAPHFYRAGHKFMAGETKTIDVTDAQLAVLQKEPKLNVDILEQYTAPPEDFPADGQKLDVTPIDSPVTQTVDVTPVGGEQNQEPSSIFEAIGVLDKDNPENFTESGKPQVKALEAILGCPITAKERDSAWLFYQDGQTGAAE